MRDLKFRVWDKKTKKMRQLVNIVFNAGFGVEPNDNTIKLIWVKGKNIIEDKDIQIQREDNFELMQFTGLHDKNGKEIFEGDIVKVKNVDYHIGQIIYDEEYAEYEIEIGKDSAFPISVLYTLSYNLDIEVIGNIYDNPELLKGEQS